MAKKTKATLEGGTYAKSHTKGTSKTVEEVIVKETSKENWSEKDITPVSAPTEKVSFAPTKKLNYDHKKAVKVTKSHTQDVKIIVEGREFLDIDDNMIICGETDTFTTEYAKMLKKLKVAE